MIQDETLEKSVFEDIPTEKIYTANAIKIGTFFCGPLVAGYCIAENFKAFNEFENAKKTWLFSIFTTLLIIALVFVIPDNVPTFIFPLTYLLITSYFLKKYQEKHIQNHIDNGGETYSGWRTALIGIISLIVFFSAIICILIINDYI